MKGFKSTRCLEPRDAVLFLRNALSGGPRAMDQVLHDARIYEIPFSEACDAAVTIGAIEYWDETGEKVMWKWHCV